MCSSDAPVLLCDIKIQVGCNERDIAKEICYSEKTALPDGLSVLSPLLLVLCNVEAGLANVLANAVCDRDVYCCSTK